jgi:hypothetical protein
MNPTFRTLCATALTALCMTATLSAHAHPNDVGAQGGTILFNGTSANGISTNDFLRCPAMMVADPNAQESEPSDFRLWSSRQVMDRCLRDVSRGSLAQPTSIRLLDRGELRLR